MHKQFLLTMALVMGMSAGVVSAAKVGVTVSPGTVKVSNVVQPGTNQFLLKMQVKNEGARSQTFTLTASGGLVVTEKPFELPAGQTKEVDVWLHVNEDTADGDYQGVVTALGREKDSVMGVETKFTCQYKVEKPKPWWETLWATGAEAGPSP